MKLDATQITGRHLQSCARTCKFCDLREAGEREVNFFQSKHNAGSKVADQYGEKEADDDYGGEADEGGDGEWGWRGR